MVLAAIHFDINKVSTFRGRTYEIYQKQCMEWHWDIKLAEKKIAY